MQKIKELTLEVTQRCLNKCIYCSSCSGPDCYDSGYFTKCENYESFPED